jgi:hypothetical protein
MLAAVASRLRPLDEAAAHAWVSSEVSLLLSPCRHDATAAADAAAGPGTLPARAAAAHAAAQHRSGAWRGRGWWQRALPSVLACIEPDELLRALAGALPAAGGRLEWQRAAGGLAGALLLRSTKAARNTLELVGWARGSAAPQGAPWPPPNPNADPRPPPPEARHEHGPA